MSLSPVRLTKRPDGKWILMRGCVTGPPGYTRDMKERTEWASGIPLVALGVIVGLSAVILVRYTDLPREPWLYLGFTVGLLSALGGMALAIIRTREVSD